MNILTVKWGTKYSHEHVNRLHELIGHCTFYCYTEDPSGLNPNINVIPIEEDLPDVWNKLALFKENFGNIKGKIMYLDLDVIVYNDLKSDLYDAYDNFTMVKCYWKPLKELYKERKEFSRYPNDYHIKTDMDINSSVMIWNQNENVHIWNTFMNDPESYMLKYLGIDRFLFWEKLSNNFFDPNLVYSRYYGIDEDSWFNPNWPYLVPNGIVCLLNGNTAERHYIKAMNDINKCIT